MTFRTSFLCGSLKNSKIGARRGIRTHTWSLENSSATVNTSLAEWQWVKESNLPRRWFKASRIHQLTHPQHKFNGSCQNRTGDYPVQAGRVPTSTKNPEMVSHNRLKLFFIEWKSIFLSIEEWDIGRLWSNRTILLRSSGERYHKIS